MFPAPEGCALFVVAALNARELGGGRFAQGLAARTRSAWSVPEERDVPVWIRRDPRITMQEAWPTVRGK